MSERRILLTGATGYVGGRLLGPLVRRGYRVRCLAVSTYARSAATAPAGA
jgi:uncharacterized protein YbjT (DUF2867 family)